MQDPRTLEKVLAWRMLLGGGRQQVPRAENAFRVCHETATWVAVKAMRKQLLRASQLGRAQQLGREVQHLQPLRVQVPLGSEELPTLAP